MFAVVKSPVQGQCAARRCKGTQHAWLEHESLSLCSRHHGEWIDGGSPALREQDGAGSLSGGTEVSASPPEAIESKLTREHTEVKQDIELIQGLPFETQDQIDLIHQVRDKAKVREKELESERRKVTDPINAALKRVNGWFKPVIKGYSEARRAANGRLLEAEQRAESEREASLQEIAAQGGHVDETTFLPAHDPPQVELGTGVGRDLPAYEIIDETAVPRVLCKPDPSLCRQAAKEALEAGVEISGLRVFWKKSGA